MPRLFKKRGVKAPIWLQKAASTKLAIVNSPSIQVQDDERSLSIFIIGDSRLNPRSPPDAGGYDYVQADEGRAFQPGRFAVVHHESAQQGCEGQRGDQK